MPDNPKARAKALRDAARELYDKADRAKTEDEKTILRARAHAKEREAGRLEDANR